MADKAYKPEWILSKFLSKIKENINIKKNSKILDVGCGKGNLLKLLGGKGYKLYGVDISEENLAAAKKIKNAKLLQADLNKGLKHFKNDYIDIIFALDVIEHLLSPPLFLKECNRVLKQEEYLILTTPNTSSLTLSILSIFGREKKWTGFQDKTHLVLFSFPSLKFLAEKYKFKVVYSATSSTFKGNVLFLPFHKGGTLLLILKKIGTK